MTKEMIIEGVDTDIYVEYVLTFTEDTLSAYSPFGDLITVPVREPVVEIEYIELRYFDNDDELCNSVDVTDKIEYDYVKDTILRSI